MTAMNTNTAITRETAFLATSGDGLPALLTSASGPFEVVQAWWPGARFAKMKTGLYVMDRKIELPRFGGMRIMPGYAIWAKLCWPIRATSKIAETEQQAFADAIELALERINGFPRDKTHGGRFLSAGETVHPPGGFPEVTKFDPEVTIPQGWLRADILYGADDPEIFC